MRRPLHFASIDRTLFLPVTLLAAALAGCGGGSSEDGTPAASSSCVTLKDGTCVTETFHNPPVLQPDANGVYQLELRPTEFSFYGQRHCGRAYNGIYPGPTIETAAQKNGEARKVRVDIHNRFTKDDYQSLLDETCTCTDKSTMASCTPSSSGHQHDSSSTCVCKNEDGEACELYNFNVTNLHFHGSHVRPDYAAGGGCVETDQVSCRTCSGDTSSGAHECFHGDDVLSRVGPGEGTQHRYDIDEDEVAHAGLSWFHPHIHGTTAIQVSSGAAGAWIVRGDLDEVAGVKNARESVFVLTTPPSNFTPLAEGQACDEDHITFDHFDTLNATSATQFSLVNGMEKPRMLIPPGEIERWRFLSASFLDEVYLAVFPSKDSSCTQIDTSKGPIPLTQIARDGLVMPKPADGDGWPFAPPYMFMSSGYRIEAMLDGSKLVDGDTLCLMGARYLQKSSADGGTAEGGTEPISPSTAPTTDDILKKISNGEVFTIINVTSAKGTATETKMPDLDAVAKLAPSTMLQGGKTDALALCAEKQKITNLDEIDQLAALWLVFYQTDGLDKCGFQDHNINAKNFQNTDRDKYPYDRVFKKGAVDHWRLTSGVDGHPFHIHINPYLVCPITKDTNDPSYAGRIFEPPFAHFRDTYLVNLTRVVDALTEYKTFTGAYVYHCHKLTHEDHGMMELIRICDPDKESCDTLCSGGPCKWNVCVEGDDVCKKELAATECLLDPKRCPEAVLRCSQCSSTMSCPADAHCRSDADLDGVTRCAPGGASCSADTDCAANEVCKSSACVAAPPCVPACMPGKGCVHGACQ